MEFKKTIPELTVNDSARKQIKLEQMEKENVRLNELVNKTLSEYEFILKKLLTNSKAVEEQQSQN